MALSPSGWKPSNITIRSAKREWGSAVRSALVELRAVFDDDFGTSGSGNDYLSPAYLPCPGPSLVGLHSIHYAIPVCPFVRSNNIARYVVWGYEPPAASGGVTDTSGVFRIMGLHGDIGGPTYLTELPSDSGPSTLGASGPMRMFALFVGG